MKQVRSDRDKVGLYSLAMFKCTTEVNIPEAVNLGLAALRISGLEPPGEITHEFLERKETEILNLLCGRPLSAIAELPISTDPGLNQAMEIFGNLGKNRLFIQPGFPYLDRP